MSEVRLTVRSADIGPVSEMLVGMGVSFRVEPLRPPEAEGERPRPAPSRKTGKRPGKAGAPPKISAKSDERAITGAERLREAIVRNQSTPPSASTVDRPSED